mmetsp:Transcript_14140/g.24010  ORF Transcript_14140/g.24010 Transcript_14140/m.24010 type:complete len:156 (-) Transcript_14140:116-583(-)
MSMPQGYSTQVGDLGGKLSGGERQRVIIARSLLKKDAKIFLFDEATSSLDPYTEQQIADELDVMMKGKTVIYCAHRLSSIKNVDRIHVLKEGKVHETGNHASLFSDPNSVYRQMWNDYLQEQIDAQKVLQQAEEKKRQESGQSDQVDGQLQLAPA